MARREVLKSYETKALENKRTLKRILLGFELFSALSLLLILLLIFYFLRLTNSASSLGITYEGDSSSKDKRDDFLGMQASLPDEQMLDMDVIWQYPEFPNGCEATSLCASLNYFGYPAEKEEIVYSYMPYELFENIDGVYHAPNPEEKYAGDPATSFGFYAFEAPVAKAANSYLLEHGSSIVASGFKDVVEEDILKAISDGFPVIAWVTIDYSSKASFHESFNWELPDGSTYQPYSNLHCVTVYGFDNAYIYINDPIEGKLSVEREDFLASHKALGSRAVFFNAL